MHTWGVAQILVLMSSRVGQYVGTCDSRDCACEGVKSTGEHEGCRTRRARRSGGAGFEGLQGVME